MDKTGVLWLNLLLRQHEICWREPQSSPETRIFAIGNSAIYGFPWPPELSAVALINRKFVQQGVPAHLFNLGLMYTYQVKEAMVLSEALRYEPDFIVYGVTLDDLGHLAPFPYLPVSAFFDANSRTVDRLAADPPPSFAQPFQRYREAQAQDVRPYAAWIEFREIGTFVRLAVQQTAKALRKKLFPAYLDPMLPVTKGSPPYRCRDVIPSFHEKYANWQDWSMLEFLADVKTKTGVEVLIVNWPVAHYPRGKCYNVRYPAAAFREYVAWMEEKAEDLGLEYLDLHDLLMRREFVDSIHPTARGQRKVAQRLGAKITAILNRNRPQ